MYTPRKESLGSTIERSPGQIQADKISELIIPPGMTPIQHLQRNPHGRYVVARNSTLAAYRKFLEVNNLAEFAKNCSLNNGEVILDENFDSPETPVHTYMCGYFMRLLGNYYYQNIHGILAAGCSFRVIPNGELIHGANSSRPDIYIEMEDAAGNIKFIVFEFNYSVLMDPTVDKINEMLQYPNVEFAIMVSVKYPIDSVVVPGPVPGGPLVFAYDNTDGYFCFSVFPKPPLNMRAAPQRIVSFGNRINNHDRVIVLDKLNAGLTDMEGDRVNPSPNAPAPLACNAANRLNPVFNYQFDHNMILLVGGAPIINFEGAANFAAFLAAAALPRLEVSLFDLKTELLAAINRMNRLNMRVVRVDNPRW